MGGGRAKYVWSAWLRSGDDPRVIQVVRTQYTRESSTFSNHENKEERVEKMRRKWLLVIVGAAVPVAASSAGSFDHIFVKLVALRTHDD
jgi:hypothetical protein